MNIKCSFLLILILLNIVYGRTITKKKHKKRLTSFFSDDSFIAPGTKWCGKGNIAENCDDLGKHKEADNCCREHDSCPYTFSSESLDKFNGYESQYFNTISHCECDVRFHQCLHENPVKPHAHNIWDAFLAFEIKCFAYLPCSNETQHDNIWNQTEIKDSGECVEGLRVAVFDTITEYSEFIVTKLTLKQKIEVNRRLIMDKDRFVSKSLVNYKCSHSFSDYKESIVENFEKEFLNGQEDFDFLKKEFNMTNKIEFLSKIEHVIDQNLVEELKNRPKRVENVAINKDKSDSTNVSSVTYFYSVIFPIGIVLAFFVIIKILINLCDIEK